MGAAHSLIRNITCDGACRREDRDQPPCRASERHIDRAGQARPIKREPREEGRARGTGKSGQGRGGGGGQGCLMPARLSKEQGAGSERPRPRKAEQERAREEGREGGGGTFSTALEPRRLRQCNGCLFGSLYTWWSRWLHSFILQVKYALIPISSLTSLPASQGRIPYPPPIVGLLPQLDSYPDSFQTVAILRRERQELLRFDPLER